MYGLINNSLKNMIIEKFGDKQWQEILSSSDVPEDSFLTMRSYDDAITYRLVDASSKVLGAPPETCLEMFGEYWVLEVASKSYGMLLDAAGNDMAQFLRNMNALHDRITSTFLDYVPPEFQVEDVDDGYKVHYLSKRQGFTPFVVGILKGLAIRFDQQVTILDQTEVDVGAGTHTIFKIQLAEK